MDRLDEWRLFAAVAERRSFSAAARAERRSPQAVTRAIAALEGRIGARLLHRTTRAVSLTDEGARRWSAATGCWRTSPSSRPAAPVSRTGYWR